MFEGCGVFWEMEFVDCVNLREPPGESPKNSLLWEPHAYEAFPLIWAWTFRVVSMELTAETGVKPTLFLWAVPRPLDEVL